MKETEKLQRHYDDLLRDFVAPLLTGGVVTVERAHAPGAIGYYEHAAGSDALVEAEIFDALHQRASSITGIRTVPWPDRDLLLLAMASVNLVHVTDPALGRIFARGARPEILAWVDQLLHAVHPPDTRADALARHALLDPVPDLRREDVVARSWAYTYRFIGRPVGSSVLSRPIFGKFRESRRTTELATLLDELDEEAHLGARRRLRALLSRSPVTELLRLDLCESFRFGLATLDVLGDTALRGGIAREIVARGEWKAAARLGRALGDRDLRRADPALLYGALALCFEVQITATLDVPGPALPEELDLSCRDTARYAAVLPAFFDDETMIDEVRALDDGDRGVVQERCARLAAALPEGVLDELRPLVRRAARPSPLTVVTNPMEVRP